MNFFVFSLLFLLFQVYSAVKAVTEAGEIQGTSSAIFLSSDLGAKLGSLFKKSEGGRQATVTAYSLAFDLQLPNDSCPMSDVQWAIQRLDGVLEKPFTSTGGERRKAFDLKFVLT